MRAITNIKIAPGLPDIVAIASEKSGFAVHLSDQPITFEEMALPDAVEASYAGYNPDRLAREGYGSLRTNEPLDRDHSPFWETLRAMLNSAGRAVSVDA